MDYSDIQTIEHDVLVVGAGGAGIRAALVHRRGGHRAWGGFRACGFGATRVDVAGAPGEGFYSALPGERHTVPRAEMYALIVVLRETRRGSPQGQAPP